MGRRPFAVCPWKIEDDTALAGKGDHEPGLAERKNLGDEGIPPKVPARRKGRGTRIDSEKSRMRGDCRSNT